MTLKELTEIINIGASHILFEYNGEQCGIDPISKSHYDVWYGENDTTVKSVEEVLSTPLFGGKSLNDIVSEIKEIEY